MELIFDESSSYVIELRAELTYRVTFKKDGDGKIKMTAHRNSPSTILKEFNSPDEAKEFLNNGGAVKYEP